MSRSVWKLGFFIDDVEGPVCVKEEFDNCDLDNLQNEFEEGDLLDDPEEYANLDSLWQGGVEWWRKIDGFSYEKVCSIYPALSTAVR